MSDPYLYPGTTVLINHFNIIYYNAVIFYGFNDRHDILHSCFFWQLFIDRLVISFKPCNFLTNEELLHRISICARASMHDLPI